MELSLAATLSTCQHLLDCSVFLPPSPATTAFCNMIGNNGVPPTITLNTLNTINGILNATSNNQQSNEHPMQVLPLFLVYAHEWSSEHACQLGLIGAVSCWGT